MSDREFEYRWSWSLPASAEALWPLVSDTNRFNRDAGLPPVEDASTDDERLENAHRHLRIRVKGLVLEWEESPFEWVRPWRFGVVRRYRGGPLREMRVLATLEPEGEGTRLTYRTSVRPRGLLGLVTIPIQIGAISRYTFGRVFKRYAAGVVAGDSRSEHVAVATPRRLAGGRLQQILNRMEGAGADAKLSAALVDHVIHADDLALARIRPYELASVWGASRRDMLTTCLHGTREGL